MKDCSGASTIGANEWTAMWSEGEMRLNGAIWFKGATWFEWATWPPSRDSASLACAGAVGAVLEERLWEVKGFTAPGWQAFSKPASMHFQHVEDPMGYLHLTLRNLQRVQAPCCGAGIGFEGSQVGLPKSQLPCFPRKNSDMTYLSLTFQLENHHRSPFSVFFSSPPSRCSMGVKCKERMTFNSHSSEAPKCQHFYFSSIHLQPMIYLFY